MAYQGVSSPLDYVLGRELGRRHGLGTRDWCYSKLYSSFKTSSVMVTSPHEGQDWGAVFGFGFSPDGKLLTAACEHRCMMLYDPLNAKLITRRFNTHDDCVNCVRFLDNRIFATCSDDNTVRLWDSRYLTNELKILRGHSSWVKNIEYASSSGKLVTSGFDGNIFTWDINNFSVKDFADPVFYINGALRTKLTNDDSKLIVSTLGGYFLLIHNLDLDHLKQDLAGFKPHLYRLMQLMNTPLHHALQYNYMFTRRRNRVEFMCDFPDSDNAESIATMQIHPHNWCVVSRNTTLDEETEWTCVHDIQSEPNENKLGLGFLDHVQPESIGKDSTSGNKKRRQSEDSLSDGQRQRLSLFSPRWILQETLSSSVHEDFETTAEDDESSSSNNEEEDSGDEAEAAALLSSNSTRHKGASSSSGLSPAASQEAASSFSTLTDLDHSLEGNNSSDSPASEFSSSPSSSTNDGNSNFPALSLSLCSRWRKRRMAVVHDTDMNQQLAVGGNRSVRTDHLRIRNVKPRLLYYAEEPNVGRGFIKEQSFSSDGRVIASPFGNIVRLLAFDKQCHELCDDVPTSPRSLVQVSSCAFLKSNILTSTFSPVHCLLAAGAVDGSIAFCHPVL